jgi:hypothetical protein
MTHIPYSRSDSREPTSAFSEVEMAVHFGTQLCGPINCGTECETECGAQSRTVRNHQLIGDGVSTVTVV